jgi:hypothetical protein
MTADPEWRALAAGVSGAVALVLGGLVVGLIEGNLLPGSCRGLVCLYTGIVLGYTGLVLAVWILVGAGVALAKRRWPMPTWRIWALRALAVASWIPAVALVVMMAGG